MSENVPVVRNIFGKKSFATVVDTTFNQLVPKDNSSTADEVTIDKFFQDYDALFYSIPTTGSVDSHLYLINRSSEYVGVSLEDLTTELQQLRNENVSLKNQLFTLTKQ